MTEESKKPTDSKTGTDRRTFLRTLAMAGGLVGASLLGLVPAVKGASSRLRPPGALVEKHFLASCIKCGQCVQVCPVEAIHVADINTGAGVGTPFINARKQACDFSCDGMQCVLACPTGALTHHINYPHEARMGVAKMVHPEKCLAAQGLGFKGLARGADFTGKLRFDEIDRWNAIALNEHEFDEPICNLCVQRCPIEIRIGQCDEGNPPAGNPLQCPPKPAIKLTENGSQDGKTTFLPEILEGCVGCGACEMVCPAQPAAIQVDFVNRAGGHA
jgi:ferredoxin-type protein NapG